MKKSERLKTCLAGRQAKRKIKFKYFILAHILVLFFAVAPIASAASKPAEEARSSFDSEQRSAYSKPFSKLIEFLNDKKNELEKYGGDFLSVRASKSGVDETIFNPASSSFVSAAFESIKSFVVDNPKQYFGTVFESVKNFVFPEDNQNDFEYNSPNSESARQEMENLKQQYAAAIDETKAISQKFSLFQNEMEKIKNGGVVVRQPIVEQKVVEKTIEKIVSGLSQTDLDSGIASVRAELNNLNTNLTNQINTLSASSNRQTSAVYQAVSLTNKIDSLSGTRLSNITVSGVSGLADSDIPDGITTSNYLPLAGGTLSGALTGTSASFSSTLTVSASTTFNGVEYKWPSADGTANQALVTNSAGGLSWTTIGGGSSDWNKQTNYGALALTASTTIPYWAKDAFYASSTSVFQGLATFGNASTSQISATNSYLGTVLSGAWNGTAISNQYGGTGLDSSALTGIAQITAGTWSASSTLSTAFGGTGWGNIQTNTVMLGNGAGRLATTSAGTDGYVLALSAGVPTWLATSTLSTITGTLAVGKGGTGQTSFGQGWLNSDGTTLSASTSPTVNYLTATSTAATSTFPYLSVTTNSNLGTVVGGTWQGTAVGDTYLTKSGDWTGTLDSNNFAGGAIGAGELIYGGSAGSFSELTLGASTTMLTTNGTIPKWEAISTNYIGEGTNLYYTDARVNTLLNASSTMSIPLCSSGQIIEWSGTRWNCGADDTGAGGGAFAWTPTTNYGASANATNTPIWFQSGLQASSTSKFVYASTTALTISGNSYLGTVSSGAWNGTAISNQYGGTGLDSSALTGIAQIVSGTWSASSTLSAAFGGTGWGNLQANTILLGNGAGRLATTSAGTDGYVLALSAGVPTWLATSTLSTITGTLAVAKGGTGATTLTGLLQGNGTSAITGITGTTGQFPYYNGTDTLLATSSLFLATSGNIGIGTSTPDSKLTVFNSAADSAIEFSSASGSTYKWTVGMDYSDAGKFKIASSTALGTIDRFTIDGNGYVGIGTSTPTRRLEVVDSGTSNAQLRLTRETGIYTEFNVAQTTGDLSLALYGANADDISLFMPDGSTGANLWVCEGAACPNGISFTGGGNLFVEGVIKYATSTTPKTRRSIILTAAGAIVPATSGAAKTQVDGNHSYYVLDYDAGDDEAAYWQWTIPDSYDNGVIDATYYWEAGATSGDVIWCFQSTGISANNSEDINPTLSPSECATDTAQANANDLALVTESATSSYFTAGEYVTFKVFRDANAGGDNMTGDARLVKVKIEYGVATESD